MYNFFVSNIGEYTTSPVDLLIVTLFKNGTVKKKKDKDNKNSFTVVFLSFVKNPMSSNQINSFYPQIHEFSSVYSKEQFLSSCKYTRAFYSTVLLLYR